MRNRVGIATLVFVVWLLVATHAVAAPVVADSLDVSHKTGVNRFYPGSWPRWAQSFTAGVSGTLDSAGFYLDHAAALGSHEGYVNAELYAITGTYGTNSIPTGAPLATSAHVDGSAVPHDSPGLMIFKFDNTVSLVRGTRYAIVLHWAFEQSDATCEVARSDQDTAVHPGNMSAWSVPYGRVWVAGMPVPADLIFSVYVNETRVPTAISFHAPAVSNYASALVYGHLTDGSGGPLQGKAVQIEYLSGSKWLPAGMPIYTDNTGRFARTMGPKTFASYRARFAGDDDYRPRTSSVGTVLPRARLTRTSAWGTKYDGKTYYYKGFIEPKHAKSDVNKVKFGLYKRGSDGKYHWKKTFSSSYSYYSSGKTRWTAKVVFPSEGKWRVRAIHGADKRNATSQSTYDYVVVK